MSALSVPRTVRLGGLSARVRTRSLLVGVVLIAVIGALVLWAATLGSAAITPGQVIAVLLGREDGILRAVVLEWRLPRITAAVVLGASLGLSGAIMQSLTRNPLGSPDIIGFNSGAYTGVVLVLLLGGTGFAALAGGALVGGILAAAIVYALAFRQGVSGFRFIIVGIAVGAFLSSLTSWFSVKADLDLALRAAVWGAGSLHGVTWTAVAGSALALAVVLLVMPPAGRWLRALELGDPAARALGVEPERARALLILLGVVTTALVTATAGPIAFVSLAAPHLARRIVGPGDGVPWGTAALLGSALLLGGDLVAQHAVPGIGLPVGAVTTTLGGLYLVMLLTRRTRRA
ncbi:FecCD family ABC transporter permease [Brachybacterium sp. AOP25-B2-12]|uniref:FecCD family ABC transporter permease n=1 Tax=Brachybacterium sp. AOP25-B2-12 TaxID=3457710 RepID=UPI00403475BC